MKYSWAEHYICAMHRRRGGGPPHGHTWRVRVTVAYEGECAEELQLRVVDACDSLSNTMLPDELAREEDLAEHIGRVLGAIRVDVWREAERLGGFWESDLLRQPNGHAS